MLRLLAILLPPVAVLFCGKPISAILNVPLTLCFWLPGVIHAWGCVTDSKADARAHRQTRALSRAARA